MKFSSLDYSSPPDEGIYWVAGTRPVIDCDADFDGGLRAVPTNETERFVALVWLTPSIYGGIEFDAVDPHNMGTVHEEDSVTHYAPFVMPPHPEESTS
ncbi:hypothetical protein [Aquipseudomonas alcaligenes]|uniref:Uncharacterized protein n=1 Tax=Aquipseudomonas alcaligenes TaxID=43263 RepID=A0A1N6XA66_AQUAC|nr:hypothetical protein [Pseudomonas alcaligenes]SIQ99167.1 hypothetical protein SAMN05878282_11248 [Pseudomonas alcaligenes]